MHGPANTFTYTTMPNKICNWIDFLEPLSWELVMFHVANREVMAIHADW